MSKTCRAKTGLGVVRILISQNGEDSLNTKESRLKPKKLLSHIGS